MKHLKIIKYPSKPSRNRGFGGRSLWIGHRIHRILADSSGRGCRKVRDCRSYCKGYSTAGLMMARMGVSVMPPGFFTQLEGLKLRILVLTLILQIYLMIELKKLVTSVAVAEIRDLYDRYQVVMPPGHESFSLGLHLGTAMTPAEWLSPPMAIIVAGSPSLTPRTSSSWMSASVRRGVVT